MRVRAKGVEPSWHGARSRVHPGCQDIIGPTYCRETNNHSQPHLHPRSLDWWRDREPGENPKSHRENKDTPHRVGNRIEPRTFLFWGNIAYHCKTVFPLGTWVCIWMFVCVCVCVNDEDEKWANCQAQEWMVNLWLIIALLFTINIVSLILGYTINQYNSVVRELRSGINQQSLLAEEPTGRALWQLKKLQATHCWWERDEKEPFSHRAFITIAPRRRNMAARERE